MRVIIAGSRNIVNKNYVFKRIDSLYLNFTEIISGGARGVDSLAKIYAEEYGVKFTEFKADWDQHGKAAGPMRNRQMAEYAGQDGCLVVLWDGKSRGSANMISNAKTVGMRIEEFRT